MGLYNDRNDVFGVTSLGVFHARLPWPLPNIIYVDVAVAVRCDPFASMRIPITFPPVYSCSLSFLPLSSLRFSTICFWRFLSWSSSPLCRFFRSFQLLSGRFSMSALWWQWSLDWNCKLYFFLPFFFCFFFGLLLFFVVLLWRVCFVFVFCFFLFRNKSLHTRFM